MCSKHLGADVVVAWPGAEIAVMGPKGAVSVISKKEISEAPKPEEKAKQLEEEYIEKFANPQMAASMGYIDDVIEPADTRRVLLHYFEALYGKRQDRPRRKHGNIPL
jgi:acetyl-CoA carboxylase carboxyltransferase component